MFRILPMMILSLMLGCEAFTPAASTPAPTPAPELKHGVQGLDSPNADIRRESALELGPMRIVDPEQRARLIRRLSVMAQGDSDALVRSAAVNALAMQSPADGLDAARRIRTDASSLVRWDAVKVMREHGDKTLIPIFIEMAKNDPEENVRREAVKSLGKFDDPKAIHALVDCLGDGSLSVAHTAREMLVKLSAGVDLGMSREQWEKWWK